MIAAFREAHNLDISRTGQSVFALDCFLVRDGAPKDQQFANVLDGRRAEIVRQGNEQLVAKEPVIGKHPNLDEPVRAQRRVEFLPDGVSHAFRSNHDHRDEMMSFSSTVLALGRRQFYERHGSIIGVT